MNLPVVFVGRERLAVHNRPTGTVKTSVRFDSRVRKTPRPMSQPRTVSDSEKIFVRAAAQNDIRRKASGEISIKDETKVRRRSVTVSIHPKDECRCASAALFVERRVYGRQLDPRVERRIVKTIGPISLDTGLARPY
jgi:hypothetical protein